MKIPVLVAFLGGLGLVQLVGLPAAEPPAVTESYYLPVEGADHDPDIPAPSAFFGYSVGTWHLRHDQIVDYLRELDRVSDRLTVREIGRTVGQRPLVVAIITAPENHARLEAIRHEHLARLTHGDSAGRPTPADAPAIVTQGFSIHGDEPSAGNAVPLLAYHLVAARDAGTLRILRELVVLLEPVRNPDGFDRFATWANANRSHARVTHPLHREHLEPWPRGRTNHYGFDPNRDWLPLVFPEGRASVELFHAWRPHLLTDHHEMHHDSTFFFQPGVPTRSNPGTPPWIFELTQRIATHHAAALDAIGALYFTKETFDDFYPGKGSTYPDLHGTVGILFEQASSRGLVQASAGDQAELTFPFTIRNQVRTALSTLRAARDLRPELVAAGPRFAAETRELAQQDPVRAWIFDDAGDPVRAWYFRDRLRRHRIQYHALGRDVAAGGRTFRPGTAWIVPVVQPQYRLLTEIFQPRTEFRDQVFYDVSAWTMPCAFGLATAAITDETATTARGNVVTDDPFPTGRLLGSQGDYGYVLDWSSFHAPRALQRLLDADVIVRGFLEASATSIDQQVITIPRGSILVPLAVQPEKRDVIETLVQRAVTEDGVTVLRLATGLAAAGVDLGSPNVPRLTPPSVLLVTGDAVNRHDAGEVWHALDRHAELGVVRTDLADLHRHALHEFTAIILVDGTYTAMRAETVEDLKRWLKAGGTLIATGRAASWAAQQEIVSATIAEPKPAEDAPPERQPYSGGPDREALKDIAGAIVNVTFDPTHPLFFGLAGTELALFRTNRLILQPAASPYETPAVYAAEPLFSGYASRENVEAIANTAAIVAITNGRGRAILMPDNPVFRGYWLAGERVLFNAIYYGGTIRRIEQDGEAD